MTNVALHAIASLLLFLALARATGSIWPAAFVAWVFAIHPLHVESVAWVSSRKDVLSGAFFAAALFAYVRFAERPDSPSRKHSVTACIVLALLSKAMAVTLPQELTLGARLHHAIQSYGIYLARAFWPTDLAAFYPYEAEYVPSFAASMAIAIAVSAAAFGWRERGPTS